MSGFDFELFVVVEFGGNMLSDEDMLAPRTYIPSRGESINED